LALRGTAIPGGPRTGSDRTLAGGSAPVPSGARNGARNDARSGAPPAGSVGDVPVAADAGDGARTVDGVVDARAASAGPASPRYDAAVAELERTLEEGRGRLDPRTLQVVERNLAIIDRAIDDARRAVAADPGNTWLRSHLAATMKRKVDLLRSATMLSTTQG
ncbi:MAG: hypothetical protein ACRENJ_05755, partial [Candidatus Eiseniibacteriota bacterium]